MNVIIQKGKERLKFTIMLTAAACLCMASLDSRPQRKRRPGIPSMRIHVHYPKKGVIRVFVDIL